RDDASEQQRDQGQCNVGQPPQHDPQQDRDRHERPNPASMKASTTVSPVLRMEIGPPLARGSNLSTSRAKLRSTSLSLGSPFGCTAARAPPSGLIQLALMSGGMLPSVICCASKESRNPASAVLSGETRANSARARSA